MYCSAVSLKKTFQPGQGFFKKNISAFSNWLAKRHKIDPDKSSASPHEQLAKHVSTLDESALSRLLLEVSLLEMAYSTVNKADGDVFLSTAKRYRIDAEKIQKAVAQEFALKKKKQQQKRTPKKAAA